MCSPHCGPNSIGFYLSSADEGKKFGTLATLSGVLTEPAPREFVRHVNIPRFMPAMG